MRRDIRAPGRGDRTRVRRTRAWTAVAVSFALLLATPGLSVAEPDSPNSSPTSLAALIAQVADANQKLDEIGAAVQARQESVNKAVADVQTARESADAAKADVDNSQQAVTDAGAAIAAAQARFDNFAAATYVNGPSASYLTAASPDDMIATATAGHTVAAGAEQVMTDLLRARTEQVNKESLARGAQQKADQAVADAQHSQDAAVAALTDAKQQFGTEQDQIDRLVAQRNEAQAHLDAARATVTKTAASTAPAPGGSTGDRWDRGANAPAPAAGNRVWDSQWDPTLPAVPSAFVSGDPIAIINTLLGVSATSAQVTQQMGRQFLQKLGLAPTPTGYTNGAIPRVYGQQASEYVIRRAMSQMGVPYSWGGGNAAGPSRGIDDGADTVGFDCSGLILYAFAGVGIRLPHYSGSQYDMGRKIPSAQMRRGDVIFYGPGGSQHVTLYLGDGQMLEAPYTGSSVKVSPVRTSGMTPYVVRYIEY
ncbi:MAG: NlpC/P60 family peptidoglycan endopeptidase RipA [Mycobacteriaceae bacterium]|nr:NlpC/P60 family peptidoglycan endopeptidase RipA [Mycobacteriaceae bacterium]